MRLNFLISAICVAEPVIWQRCWRMKDSLPENAAILDQIK